MASQAHGRNRNSQQLVDEDEYEFGEEEIDSDFDEPQAHDYTDRPSQVSLRYNLIGLTSKDLVYQEAIEIDLEQERDSFEDEEQLYRDLPRDSVA